MHKRSLSQDCIILRTARLESWGVMGPSVGKGHIRSYGIWGPGVWVERGVWQLFKTFCFEFREQYIDIRCQFYRIQCLIIPPDWLTVVIYQKLLKVPPNIVLMFRFIV